MFRNALRTSTLALFCFYLTACPQSGVNSGPTGAPGKDATEIADGSMDPAKIKASALDNGKVLAVENGVVVAKLPSQSDAPGTVLFKNSVGAVVAKQYFGTTSYGPTIGVNGYTYTSIGSSGSLSAIGIGNKQGYVNMGLVFSGLSCTGEARFVIGDSNAASSEVLLGAHKSFAQGAPGVFYEVDTASGVRLDSYTAMSHQSGATCVDSTTGGTIHTRSMLALSYPNDPLVELDIQSAEVK